MAGKIIADQIEHSTAGSLDTSYVIGGSAKVWVNFDGTGTIASRDSLNLSSLTDNGTGDYTVNISSAMSDANYGAVCSGSIAASAPTFSNPYTGASFATSAPTSSAFRFANFHYNGASYKDVTYTTAAINGDLA